MWLRNAAAPLIPNRLESDTPIVHIGFAASKRPAASRVYGIPAD